MRLLILTLSAENAVTIYFNRKSKPSYLDSPTFPPTMLRRQRNKSNEESPRLACCGETHKLEIKAGNAEDITVIKAIKNKLKKALHFLSESNFLAASHVNGEAQDCSLHETASR